MNPAMLFINTTAFDAAQIALTSVAGLFGIASALNGYLYRPINPLFRVLLIAGGLCMMIPGNVTDLIGVVVVVAIILIQRAAAKKDSSAAA
jgi:TRAP-type uncharacterized transport system fused permease subunit